MMRYEVSGLPGAGQAVQRMVRAILDHADVLDRLENNYFEYCLRNCCWAGIGSRSPISSPTKTAGHDQLLPKSGGSATNRSGTTETPAARRPSPFQGRHQLDAPSPCPIWPCTSSAIARSAPNSGR